MNPHVVVHPRAVDDLRDQFRYLERSSPERAVRFLVAVEAAINLLVEMPGLGRIRSVDEPALADVRQWPVKGFENYLIFYRPTGDLIEILRVLHGARDIDRILLEPGDETEPN